ncbi:piggyBac transposable element-derived protein 4-like [Centruroides vittatus]|uniref:piggyBac transposable element-derived protein 4-like n=1 Tax=Centruroides vittatus TaxID=120091 RepID=UPI00350FEE67
MATVASSMFSLDLTEVAPVVCDKSSFEEETDSEQEEESEEEEDEEESEEEEESLLQDLQPFYLGRDATRWSMIELPSSLGPNKGNVSTHLPGPVGEARMAESIMECWSLFVSEYILRIVVQHTNEQIKRLRPKYKRERDAKLTDLVEIKALVGILYLTGCKKLHRCNPTEIWTTDGTGLEVVRTVMSEKRFRFLLVCLRFDDKKTRKKRLQTDKLAAVRDIIDPFIESCRKNYCISEFCTIDEKLEGFRGRCGFLRYMPKKPNKYGIEIFMLVDSRMFYTHNLEIYCGKQPEGPYSVSNSPEEVVKRLTKHIAGSGRNVTMDNRFTSFKLAMDLLKEKLTMVGTIRKHHRVIPKRFLDLEGRTICSSVFGFREDATLVSYVPKKNKNVLLLSSMHHSGSIDQQTGSLQKPEIITFYNMTKGGVDTVDQLTGTYNCARTTRRWPMIIFYCMLNIAGINSQIIHQSNGNCSKVSSRREYLKRLALELMYEQIDRRKLMLTLPTDIRISAERIRPSRPEVRPKISTESPNPTKARRCKECGRKKNRKTRKQCIKCETFLCLEHLTHVCRHCLERNKRF